MKIKAGDYILTRHNQLFRVVDVHYDSIDNYLDLRSYKVDSYPKYANDFMHLKCFPESLVSEIGEHIPEEKASKTLKLLYG